MEQFLFGVDLSPPPMRHLFVDLRRVYPPTHSIEDEVGFINQALIWQHGSLTAEGAGIISSGPVNDLPTINNKHVSWRNPGRSLIILPFVALLGIKSVFLSGMIIHLVTVLTSGLLLVRYHCSPLWSVFVLFHPTLRYDSRTVMGDAPAAMFLLLAIFALTRADPSIWLAGALVGIATINRYHAIIATVPLLLIVFRRHINDQPLRSTFYFSVFRSSPQ